MKSLYSILKHFRNALARRAEALSYLILYFLSVYPCFKYIKNHFSNPEACPNVVCGILLIAVLSFTLPFLYRYYHRQHQRGFIVIIPLACLCSLAASPSLLHTWTDWMISTFYITGFLAVTYAILKKWSFILWFLWLLLPLAETLASSRYQLSVDAHLIAEILGASPQDVAHFISPPNIALLFAWILGTCLLSIALSHIIRKYTEKRFFFPGIIIVLFAWAVATATHRPLWSISSPLAPENCILKVYQATKLANSLQSRIISIARKLPSAAAPTPGIPAGKKTESCICLLHIGESVRSDHLSLFGYTQCTTPNLDKRKNIIAYRDCVAVAPSTVASTFALLTNAKTDIRNASIDSSLDATCGSIMDIFHALDFACYAFMPNDNINETWGATYEKLLHLTFAARADRIDTLPDVWNSHTQIQQISEAIHSGDKRNKFCLINNYGSHLPFIDFDHDNPPFSPASSNAYNEHPDKNARAAKTVQNTYDCTIHRLDAYIEKLLGQLHGKPYIYIYVSDHGEFLGDQGIWVRNGNREAFYRTPVCQVPLLIIYSPEFEQQNPHMKKALENLRQHSDMSIGQEHVFHTLLGLFGIHTPYYEEELDLTSDKVRPYTGPHPSRNGKATDGKKWY